MEIWILVWVLLSFLTGAAWALVEAFRRIERLDERNAAQAQTIAALKRRLVEAGGGDPMMISREALRVHTDTLSKLGRARFEDECG